MDPMEKTARSISRAAAIDNSRTVDPHEHARQNDHKHSYSSVRHHDDGGGTHVPSDQHDHQAVITPPNRGGYASGGTDPETPRGGSGYKSGHHGI